MDAWSSRGRRESRSTVPCAAASVTGLMVAGANLNVTVANVAVPVPAAPGRMGAWIHQAFVPTLTTTARGYGMVNGGHPSVAAPGFAGNARTGWPEPHSLGWRA